MGTFKAKTTIFHNGKKYLPGENIELSDKEAARIQDALETGAVQPKQESAPAPALTPPNNPEKKVKK